MNKSDPDINKQAIQLQGRFGKLFLDYTGCPRGPMGRACEPIEKEVFEMPVITDTDGGRWIPVNEDALRELVNAFKALRGQEEAEKNEPLTLEELREMDGEPVYVVSYNSDETGWRIVDSVVDYRGAVFDSDRVNVFFNDSFLEDGRTINEEWFAYLRKPKEA